MKNQIAKISLEKVVQHLKERNFEPIIIENKKEALEKIKELIPQHASVMNGTSRTLEQIGFVEYLKSGRHGWKNLHEVILAEKDPAKQVMLRKQSVVSDYYLGSVHAFTEQGELMIASNSGSQLPHLAYTSQHIILVVSTKKIVEDITAGFRRIDEAVVPLEDTRMKEVYGFGTTHAKTLILHRENPAMGRTIHILLVKEDLGF